MHAPDDEALPAFQLMMSGQHAAAIALYDALIRRYPGDSRLFGHRGLCHSNLGDKRKALIDYQQARALASTQEEREAYDRSVKDAEGELALYQGKTAQSYEMPLYTAAAEGDLDTVRRLLDEGANVELGKSARVSNESPLAVACRKGRVEIAKLLVARGADVNARSDIKLSGAARHFTPLCHAAYAGQAPLVPWLVSQGADPLYVDELGCNLILNCLVGTYDEPERWEAALEVVRHFQSLHVPVDERSQKLLDEIVERLAREKRRLQNKDKPVDNAHTYFVFMEDWGEVDFAIDDGPKGSQGRLVWRTGKPLRDLVVKDPAVRFKKGGTGSKWTFADALEAGHILKDVLETGGEFLIVSPRMRDLLAAEGVDNFELIEVRVDSPQGEVISRSYSLLNPIRTEDAIDLERSNVRRDAMDHRRIGRIRELVLDRSNLDPEAKLFCCTGYSNHLFIRDDLKLALEKAGITGWKAVPIEGWNGLSA